MTVCIAAVCADGRGEAGRAVVVASDRMVTMGGLTEFEHEVPKVTHVTDRIVALYAGDALRGAQLVRDLRPLVQGAAPTVPLVAQTAAAHYGVLRRQLIESQIFAPRGIAMAAFYQGLQQQLVAQLAGVIDQQVIQFNYGVDFLLAGVDDEGGHIFSVANPGGAALDYEPIGFEAVGSGALHARQSLIGFGHHPGRPLPETVFRVFASKRRAEAAPGVGSETDLWIVHAGGCVHVGGGLLQELDGLYREFQRPALQQLDERVSRLPFLEHGAESEADDQRGGTDVRGG